MLLWQKLEKLKVDEFPVSSLGEYLIFLKDYQKAAIRLRCIANNDIGFNIQKKIDEFPDHMHFVSCGDAHIINNPLYQYVRPPIGTFGIADEKK